jgi:ABC-2 type transport system permease protein
VSLGVVARTDFRQAGRSWRFLGLGTAFVFFFTGAAAVFAALGRLPGGATGAVSYPAALVSPLGLLFPLVGVLTGYPAVVGERASGTVRLLLSLPNSRREVVFGKLLSRVTLAALLTLVGAAVGYVAVTLFGVSVSVVEYALVVAIAAGLQATFVAIGVGLSATTDSTALAPAAGLGAVVLFTMLWEVVVGAVEDVASLLEFGGGGPFLTEFLYGLNPVLAFSRLASLVVDAGGQGGPPWGDWWFPLLVLLGWFATPVVLGAWRFERAAIA